jgi:hypothetical protein
LKHSRRSVDGKELNRAGVVLLIHGDDRGVRQMSAAMLNRVLEPLV